ncbi:FHA domain-containing protein [Cyanobacterium stanieri LEGE 03274]|uniref:FHA domain-containing protein n=1 Tax=Cyanobacterium stanieri LEGE 03274 TaxID=1828756 RepID=A0ABR9V576_9CHRO|nr:FHA domain-containing protein [Cyanobacterium stanieri]MBE9221989.1 FHA domain-containing protein [Cyanobacterium stanieri LEGE 03274]
MITCPNCQYENPDGATVCELCFTPLGEGAVTTQCPNCKADVPPNATFCGECGFSLTNSVGTDDVNINDINMEEASYQTPSAATRAETSIKQETFLQMPSASLLHVQTNTTIELASDLPVIHLGKANETVPPDIDVSGFPNSQIVSRIHADIRQENGSYFLEDTGSANGTYVNHVPLARGNRHCLSNGDRIALGKEDKVTFIFQVN